MEDMKKGEWIRSIWLKAPAFILAVALVPIITLSLLALWFGYDCGWWTEQPASFYDTPIIKMDFFIKSIVAPIYNAMTIV